MKSPLRQRVLWVALLMFAGLAVPAAQAHARHNDAWARDHFATAERMREALNGRPAADRTRRDYQHVLNAYRNVYLGAPASTKADPSVVAVAETLVEMGRRFSDDKVLNEAIEQYKFLRREYPGSKYRFDGLFTIGEIYKDDLNDPEAARAAFQEFLHRYPHNRLADGAREAIVELNKEAKAEKPAVPQKATEKARADKDVKNKVVPKNADAGVEKAADGSSSDHASADNSLAENSPTDRPSTDHPPLDHAPRAISAKGENPTMPSGRLPRVTGIRHWSTPDYTRVAIDVEKDVKFSSQRIDSPARIFFDLRDTKLASTLVGKSFDVDDGFLKKVRVAQFAPGRTRVVLEVDNLSDYDAFLLPNPYRLIIDIHGRDSHTRNAEAKNAEARNKKNREKDAGESASDEPEDLVAVGKAIPDVGSDASEENVSSTHTSTQAGKISVVSAEVVKGAVSESETAVPAKKSPSSVVKKIVEADDDKDSIASVPTRNLKDDLQASKRVAAPLRITAAAKKPTNNDLDNENSAIASDLIREAKPTASGDRSLIRALGLKIGKIVIDPGHGGHDTGTIGPGGLEEKDLVLDVGRRLGKLLETRLGAEVVYTRKDDTFIPLETRTAVANQARADLFVSIHANSSRDPGARGVETYYLNFTSSPEALEVAARENAVSEKSIYELQDLVKKIALKEKIEESREFAGDVQQSLHSGLAVKSPAIRDRGVKKAPFIVLIGANMPSILAEVSFVSNPTDERRLSTGEYRQRIAESIYRGIAHYVNGLSGVKVASKMDKAGQ
ncbi:MAG: N-acetylmuramoyl-L-alanine amidase [Candidatus Sulfotelmatobacter sp.]